MRSGFDRAPLSVGLFLLMMIFGAPHANATPEAFIALENRLTDALAAYDKKLVDELWDDEFVFVGTDGGVAHKQQRLAGLVKPVDDAGQKLVSYNDSVDLVHEDARFAVVLVHSTWTFGSAAHGDPYLTTHVWIKRGSRWRLLSAHVALAKK